MKLLHATLLALSLLCPLLPNTAFAGFDEGDAAYKKKDYATALNELKPLAERGHAVAQNILGLMYNHGNGVAQDHKEAVRWYRLAADQGDANAQSNLGIRYANDLNHKEAFKWFRLAADQGIARAQFKLGWMYYVGDGVPQDYKEALKWYRPAADQGNAIAQSNLGWMYQNGQGVAQSRVIAYGLYNLSAAGDPSSDNKATINRTALAESMGNPEIEAAQDLTRELGKPNNLLKALDQYAKKPTVKEKAKAKPVAANEQVQDEPIAVASNDPYPARPAKQPGVVSCNTRCVNAACWRTYDNGRKVQFQAKSVFDPFSSSWKFDSGNC